MRAPSHAIIRAEPIGSPRAPSFLARARQELFTAPVPSKKLLAPVALGLLLAVTPGAFAAPVTDVSDRLPKLARLTQKAAGAPAPQAYAAIREIWTEWDQGDPTEVEEALRSVSASRTGSTRAYADLLLAYARRRRGDLDGARAKVKALGYVSSWVVAGSFDNEGKTGLERAFGPESEPRVSLASSYQGKERKVAWRKATAAFPFGWVDTSVLVRPTEKACVFATAFVRDPTLKAPQKRVISIWAGAAGAMRVYWNGTLAIEDKKYRDFDAERSAANVTLEAGENRVLVKTCGDDSAPMFTVRLAAPDGSPDAHLEASSDVAFAADAEKTWKKQALPGQTVSGPVQAFEAAVKGGDPATQEAYARYLVATQSDDDSEHLARELASKAAQRAPTVRRALLAGSLAESRNQRGDWIAKAEELVKKGGVSEDEKDETLLARAAHARSGINWRDAIPYYDAALARNPDDVPAILARAELFGEAGLRATSLAFLEKALVRRPRSVALLRTVVSALRQEDRTTDALEMEERYAAFRFDDTTLIKEKIDLAVARRDPAQASPWVDRLLALDPDGVATLETAARTYLTFGDRPRAIAMYKRALDLAPEDTDAMRALADVYGLAGAQGDQQSLLRKILELQPQAKDVRDYLTHLTPEKPRPDEAYAIPKEQFLAKRDAPAAGADGRRLVDLNVVTVFPNGLSSKFTQVVFQPLTEAAAQSDRVYGFPFESDTQTVQLRAVHVYRKTGEVDDSFDSGTSGQDDPSMAMYTSASAFRVRFARLSPGDVVELQYRVEDVAERNAFADYFGDVSYLQSNEPVSLAKYVLITPKTRTFYFNKPTIAVAQTVEEKGDQRVYQFTAQDLAPVLPEPNQAPYTEFLGHVHVSTYKSWDEMGQWYWGLVKDQFTADDEVRKRVAEITKGKKTDREKINAVYDYVVQKTRYVALEFGIHGFKPYKCAQIFARGFGDCKDKATLIVTMLKELGIPATIVIVRTGLRGDFEDAPASLAPFDHAIAYVPSIDHYLDGTAEYTGSDELPAMDRGSLALQVNEGHPKLVHLPDPPASESVTTRTVEATMAADGSAALSYQAAVTGVSASSWRMRYHAEATRKQRLVEDLGGEYSGIEVQSVAASDLEDVERSPEIKVRARVPSFARRDGANYSVAVGPSPYLVREYASLSARKLDVRLRAQTTSVSDHTIKLPPGAKVLTSPVAASGSTPFGSYAVTVDASVTGHVHVKTTIVIQKTRIAASEYGAFRAFCESADRALGQRLVLAAGK